MQIVIQTLREIDAGANRVMQSSEDQKAELKTEYENRIKAAELKIQNETKGRLDVLESQLANQVSDKILKMKEEASRDLELLDDNYKKNHDQYVEAIFQKIIEV